MYDPYNSIHEANIITSQLNELRTDVKPAGPKAPRHSNLLSPRRRREAAIAYNNAVLGPFTK